MDAHNIVPVWVASPKQEVGARTLRKKIHDQFPEYFVRCVFFLLMCALFHSLLRWSLVGLGASWPDPLTPVLISNPLDPPIHPTKTNNER